MLNRNNSSADKFQLSLINNIERIQSIMLGLQSNIEQQPQTSSLSISSQINTGSKDQNPSTNYASSFQKSEEFSPHLQLESKTNDKNFGSPRARDLRIKLNYLLKMQQNLNQKMNGYVATLEKQIMHKQQENDLIEKQVKKLRNQIYESRADIVTLSQIFNKRKKAATAHQSNENDVQQCVVANSNKKNTISFKKITRSPFHSGRFFTQKPGSPKTKASQHSSHKKKLKQQAQALKKGQSKDTKYSSYRYMKFAKSP